MNTIKIVNVKCEGCAKTIISELSKIGLKNVSVNVNSQEVFFEGDVKLAKKELERIGYPEVGSQAAKSALKKARSFVSCAMGKVK